MLRRLTVNDFRNIASADIDLQAPEVFLVGENGQGKTNLLEAIYLLCYASSFRSCPDAELIAQGKEAFTLHGDFTSTNEEWGGSVKISADRTRKNIFLDGKQLKDRSEMVSRHPCVVFCHDDMDFSQGAPERRRWFFDQTASLASPAYMERLRNYRRVLKMRNASLRGADRDLIKALDLQLARYGLALMEARKQAVEHFDPLFRESYAHVSQLPFEVGVEYRPSWKSADEAGILAHLEERLERDIELGLSSSGPHRDRYAFQARGRDFSSTASTGQLRLLSLCLRTCQARYCSLLSARDPILLFDDVLLELDPERRRRFMEILPAYDQAFFTFLPGEPYASYAKKATKLFSVDDGRYAEGASGSVAWGNE